MNILFFLTPKSQIKYVTNAMTIRQVLEVMDHYRFTTIPMLNEAGEYEGTLSEGDLLFFLKNNPEVQIKDLNTISILKVIRNKDYLPIKIDTNMSDLILNAVNQNFVPVIDDNQKFIGIITRKSIINYLYLNSKIED